MEDKLWCIRLGSAFCYQYSKVDISNIFLEIARQSCFNDVRLNTEFITLVVTLSGFPWPENLYLGLHVNNVKQMLLFGWLINYFPSRLKYELNTW